MSGVQPPIPSRANGNVIDQTWFNQLKTAADDHEDRIASIENEIFQIPMLLAGPYHDLIMPFETNLIIVPPVDLVLIDVEVMAIVAGIAGSLEIDIKHNESGSFVSCLSTKPTVAYTVGDLGKSTNGVIDSGLDEVSAGKIIRCDITQKQTSGRGFLVMLTAQRG